MRLWSPPYPAPQVSLTSRSGEGAAVAAAAAMRVRMREVSFILRDLFLDIEKRNIDLRG